MSPFGNKSPCHQTDKDADAIVVAHIFNRVVIEKRISPCSLAIVREEEINPQNQKKLYIKRP
jgi:hypothetical protein